MKNWKIWFCLSFPWICFCRIGKNNTYHILNNFHANHIYWCDSSTGNALDLWSENAGSTPVTYTWKTFDKLIVFKRNLFLAKSKPHFQRYVREIEWPLKFFANFYKNQLAQLVERRTKNSFCSNAVSSNPGAAKLDSLQ